METCEVSAFEKIQEIYYSLKTEFENLTSDTVVAQDGSIEELKKEVVLNEKASFKLKPLEDQSATSLDESLPCEEGLGYDIVHDEHA